MSLAKHIYGCDRKRRVSLSSRFNINGKTPEMELVVDLSELGKEIDVKNMLTDSDKKSLAKILGESERFSARIIGVIMPRMATPIQDYSEIVRATFRQMSLQKYPIKVGSDNRFVMPDFNLGTGRATFQDLRTLDIQGQVTNVLAIALILPIPDKTRLS